MELKNKVALITGASKGMGQSIAVALAKEGCSVIINFKSDSVSARAVLEECNKYSNGNLVLQADVSNEIEVKTMFEKIKKTFKHLDILINNAGIFDDNDSPSNIDAFENIYRNNFLSSIIVTKYALKLLKIGKIVNMSSIHGRLGYGRPTAISYSAFKAALENYTKNLAKALAPKILVNAIAPGRVMTSMWGKLNNKEQQELGKAHLIKRMIKPDEISNGVVFILKNDAICGEILTIDGGYSLLTLD
ncbi:MAG: SDR family oxidoreductase [Candidatus Shapirobacteria bacterium]|nr:SDR family oxidoreductase [Candidatus Shapirobacteria bacterium]